MKIKLIIIAFTTVIFLPLAGLACGCSGYKNTDNLAFRNHITANYNRASYVFTGEVVNRKISTVAFRVNQIWKGNRRKKLELNTGWRKTKDGMFGVSNCINDFRQGTKHLIFAYKTKMRFHRGGFKTKAGLLRAHTCSPNVPVAWANSYIEFLNKIVKLDDIRIESKPIRLMQE